MRIRLLEPALVGALLVSPAFAADVTVSGAWMRALPAHLPAAGYFTLRNRGKDAVSLTGANSTACGMLMLHKSTQSGGVGGMEDVASVAVPAGGELKFAPGSYHLMCMDPTAAVKPGTSVEVTLSFSDGGKAVVAFAVKNAQGK